MKSAMWYHHAMLLLWLSLILICTIPYSNAELVVELLDGDFVTVNIDGPESAAPTSPPTFSSAPSTSSSPSYTPSNSPPPTTGIPTLSPTTLPPTTSSPTTAPPTPNPTVDLAPRLIEVVGDDQEPAWAFPLGNCQGDCDSDGDCQVDLYCVQRDDEGDFAGGCLGADTTAVDVCAPKVQDPNVQIDAFRLRLFWEEGYVWQESTIESFWCVSLDDYDSDDQVHLRECDGKAILSPEQAFVFVPLNPLPGTTTTVSRSEGQQQEVLIQVGYKEDENDSDWCWERDGREIFLESCDSSNTLQRWIAQNGTFAEPSFEITQLGFEQQCVSNDHHPRDGEVIEMHSCRALRLAESQTNLWTTY